jgi:hypothetical protein
MSTYPMQPGTPPIFGNAFNAGNGSIIVKGFAAPNAMIYIYHAGGSPFYGQGLTDSYGNFTVTITTPLVKDAYGNTPIALAEFNQAGQQASGWTGATLNMGTTGPITTPPPVTPPAGGPNSAPSSPPTVTSAMNNGGGQVQINGSATPNSTVLITGPYGSPIYANVPTDPYGNFSALVTTPFAREPDGTVKIALTQRNLAGQQTSPMSVVPISI